MKMVGDEKRMHIFIYMINQKHLQGRMIWAFTVAFSKILSFLHDVVMSIAMFLGIYPPTHITEYTLHYPSAKKTYKEHSN